MNRNLGTTVILTAPTDNFSKLCICFNLFDKGKISKIVWFQRNNSGNLGKR